MHRTLNLGILAHVDAGKTSLTERLLFDAGVIAAIGRVDDGTTQTDTLELERRRGITIKSAVVSFRLGDTTINLIDTPGHPDFIAEVERAVVVLDGAVLVISAVEGVQSQTRVLLRTLHRLGIPTLMFINKIDRAGAAPERVLEQIRTTLSAPAISMGAVESAGTPSVLFRPYEQDAPGFIDRLTELVVEHDDQLLVEYVESAGAPDPSRLRRALARQTALGLLHPVYSGSALTGAGLDDLRAGVTALLPTGAGDPAGALQAQVFKVERGPAGERIAYVRVRHGTLRVRDVVRLPDGRRERLTGLRLIEPGRRRPATTVPANCIAVVSGLTGVRVGDWLGLPGRFPARLFAPPTLETVVEPDDPSARGALHTALERLAEQDPLISLRQDDVRQELYLSLYGEVQKEVLQTTLAEQFGLCVSFRQTAEVCIERPTGVGEAVELKDAADNPFLATVGLRIEPGRPGSGVQYQLGVELGSMPYAFLRAVEETVFSSLAQGLHGWAVTDCSITLTHSGYFPRQSHMGAKFDKSMSSTGQDFRLLTPLVLMAALRRAGTVVCRPISALELEVPADSAPAVLSTLTRLHGVPLRQQATADGYLITGLLPAAEVFRLQQRLPGLTSGQGTLTGEFDSYAPTTGEPPQRPRTDRNPLDRKEYLLHVQRKV